MKMKAKRRCANVRDNRAIQFFCLCFVSGSFVLVFRVSQPCAPTDERPRQRDGEGQRIFSKNTFLFRCKMPQNVDDTRVNLGQEIRSRECTVTLLSLICCTHNACVIEVMTIGIYQYFQNTHALGIVGRMDGRSVRSTFKANSHKMSIHSIHSP